MASTSRAMLDLSVLEVTDDNANISTQNVAPGTDVCYALLSADEFTPNGCAPLILDVEDEDLDVGNFLDVEETSSDDLQVAVRNFQLDWLPCFAHLLQLPIVGAIAKEVLLR